jgi:hypothetical protein
MPFSKVYPAAIIPGYSFPKSGSPGGEGRWPLCRVRTYHPGGDNNAGPHQEGDFDASCKAYCHTSRGGWHWIPQAPQMPYANDFKDFWLDFWLESTGP